MMSITLPIETAEQNLRDLLEELNLGETVTLLGAEGVPRALLVSLKPALREIQEEADWDARWDALARQVSQAWNSDKSAVELLTEMRR
jgi:antitoxin (DNA-binding transcriptional repressor) of toxin-antitoxin stability system